MVVIEKDGESGLSFFYPLGAGLTGRVRVINFVKYQKKLAVLSLISVFLCGMQLALLSHALYSDTLFDLAALALIIFGAVRIWAVRATTSIVLTPATKIRRGPLLASADFGGFFAAIGLMDLNLVRHSVDMTEGPFEVAAIGFLLFALFPLANMVAFSLGLGRPKQ